MRDAALPCALQAQVTLGVGKTVSYTLTGTGTEVLGASGTPGTYFLVDEVTLDGESIRVNAGELNIAR